MPIETKNRELLGKTFLAAKAVSKGWAVVLGPRSAFKTLLPNALPGFFSEISIPDKKLEKNILPFVKAGHTIGNICEEGIVYPDAKDYCNRKVGVDALRYTSIFFATGQRQLDDVQVHRDTSNVQMMKTGNVRFDLLRPGLRATYDNQAEKIVNELGRYILVNTNFSLVNPHPSYGDRLSFLIKSGTLSSQDQVDLWKEMSAYKKLVMRDFMLGLIDISKNFDIKIVIRPHPSEDHNFWKRWVEGKRNIVVFHHGDVNNWLVGADALIHEGCTTGIEGFLLDKPVIAYSQLSDSYHFKNIANELSSAASTKGELLEMIASIVGAKKLNDDSSRDEKIHKLKFYIENVDGDFAADKILDCLGSIDTPEYEDAQIERCLSYSGEFMSRPNNLKYLLKMQKFEGLDLSEIVAPMKLWFKRGYIDFIPNVSRLNNELFLITHN